MSESKTCTKCNETKSIDDFPNNGLKKKSRCKSCNSEIMSAKYAANPEKYIQNVKDYRSSPGKKEMRHESDKLWRQNNYGKSMALKIRGKCKKHGIPFSLEPKDIVIPTHCPILGIPIVRHLESSKVFEDSPAIDRIHPKKGYVKGNVAVISSKANRMKQDATIEELEAIVRYIEEHLAEQQKKVPQ